MWRGRSDARGTGLHSPRCGSARDWPQLRVLLIHACRRFQNRYQVISSAYNYHALPLLGAIIRFMLLSSLACSLVFPFFSPSALLRTIRDITFPEHVRVCSPGDGCRPTGAAKAPGILDAVTTTPRSRIDPEFHLKLGFAGSTSRSIVTAAPSAPASSVVLAQPLHRIHNNHPAHTFQP